MIGNLLQDCIVSCLPKMDKHIDVVDFYIWKQIDIWQYDDDTSLTLYSSWGLTHQLQFRYTN